MGNSVITYIQVNLFLLLFHLNVEYCVASSETHYECGPHGRFEYCIDGIPGCVVGCHCHPGYYFDTESKICEPNVKLSHDYRRNYYLEPTRMPVVTSQTVTYPTPTTSNPIEEKVDEIAKDTDDLGDWLYNQFFKTIENQVINNTDNQPLTRRSGGKIIKPQRRSRKKGRKKYKRKRIGQKYSKKGLRRKLLKITEDDSLFDSSSGSSSARSSDSSSSDSTSIEDSHDDDKDHGHRKIVMINKKPKPPLPSFIFLPNADTPFYPPIGLPPPPIAPMYPMIPVPPVGPIYPGYVTLCKNETESTTTSTTTTTTTTSAKTTSTSTTEAPPEARSKDISTEDKLKKSALRTGQQEQRNKMIQKLRNKMRRRHKKQPMEDFMDTFHPEISNTNDLNPQNSLQFKTNPIFEGGSPVDDVDFKYLSQLIHKIDLNQTNPEVMLKSNHQSIDFPTLNSPLRRNFMRPKYVQLNSKINRPASKADDVTDTYYSNLGKQIASLIRNVDIDGQREINIAIEQDKEKNPLDTIFDENRYAPRSYWERFVRSPLKFKQGYDYNSQMKQSSENLVQLEDQVNGAAEIERILSLPELENIVNIMKKSQSETLAKQEIKHKEKDVTQARLSNGFNVNLLLPISRRIASANPMNNIINKDINNKNIDTGMFPQITKGTNYNSYAKHIVPKPAVRRKQISKRLENRTSVAKNTSKNFLAQFIKLKRTTPSNQQISRIANKTFTHPTHPTQPIIKYQLNPMMLNYKSMNFIGGKRNQYVLQNSIIPLPILTKHSSSTSEGYRMPYFHQQFSNFDFFE